MIKQSERHAILTATSQAGCRPVTSAERVFITDDLLAHELFQDSPVLAVMC